MDGFAHNNEGVLILAATNMPWGVDLFEAPHNQPITWEHLLRQSSDWSGTLWGKPDWGDRPA